MKTIYVIVPVYNVEKYLVRCVESILNQTYTDFSLILVGDGSKDSSPQICDEYSKRHNNIIVIHKINGRMSSARNTGIEYVKQNCVSDDGWITFVDSDDYIHPLYLEYLLKSVYLLRQILVAAFMKEGVSL